MNMIEKRKAAAGQSGFTLIELLVVIAILAVLGGAAIIGIGAMRSNATKQVCKTDKKTIETAAEAWALDTDSAATTADQSVLVAGGYLKTSISTISNPTRANVTTAFTSSTTC